MFSFKICEWTIFSPFFAMKKIVENKGVSNGRNQRNVKVNYESGY